MSEPESLIAEQLQLARAGDARAAARAASLIHLFPAAAQASGVNAQYRSLLGMALRSNDAELVSCVAEQLLKGSYLAIDADLASRFLDRADRLSPFMGRYVFGRLASHVDDREAIRRLKAAEDAGHLPSRLLRHKLMVRRLPAILRFIGFFIGLVDFVVVLVAATQKPVAAERFWRYRDIFPSALEPVDAQIKGDRRDVFEQLQNHQQVAQPGVPADGPRAARAARR